MQQFHNLSLVEAVKMFIIVGPYLGVIIYCGCDTLYRIKYVGTHIPYWCIIVRASDSIATSIGLLYVKQITLIVHRCMLT